MTLALDAAQSNISQDSPGYNDIYIYIYIYHETKFGCKQFISSKDMVELVIF